MEAGEPSQPDGHVENAKLCATCHNLDSEKAKPTVIFQAWSLCLTYAALLTARTRGCAFCDILASIFEQLWQGSRRKLEDANPSVTVSVPTREIDNLAASFDSPTPRPFYAGVEEQCIDLVLTVPQKYYSLPFRALRVGGHVPVSPRNEGCFQQVSKWLKQCLSDHQYDQCESERLRGQFYVPDRLIKVPGQEDDAVLLDLSRWNNGKPAIALPNYAALSYCWGTAQGLTTTRATLHQRSIGIPWHSLPETFKDALLLCRALGIEYLWIDSLCIIQDDENDWLYQSGYMHKIYGHAIIVIAADAASDSNGGCFIRRSGTSVFKSNTPEGATESPTVLVQRRVSHNLRFYPPSILDGGRWPLSMRAWALQERLLATRIVHFTADEIMWECSEGIFCECKLMDTVPQRSLRRSYTSAVSAQSTDKRAASWCEIVQIYASKLLTRDTDRLPAILGLAKRFEDHNMGSYMAGIWTEYLLKMMSWQSIGFGIMSHRRPSDYTAPTWSWASVVGPVAWDIRDGAISEKIQIDNSKYVAKVIKVECAPALLSSVTGATPEYGRITDGFATIMCPTLTTKVQFSESGDPILTSCLSSRIILDVPAVAGQFEVDDGEMVKCAFLEKLIKDPITAICLRRSRSSRRGKGALQRVGRVWFAKREELPELQLEELVIE